MLRQQQDDADEEVSIYLDKTVDLVKSMVKVLVQKNNDNAIKEGLPVIKDFLAKISELQKIRQEALNKECEVIDRAMSAQTLELGP